MKHGSLFSGIGGFDLAAEWMGWDNVFHCEIEPKLLSFLKQKWPKSTAHKNIYETDFTIYRGRIDVLSGGFPCQKFSLNGKGSMDLSEWKEMLRALRETGVSWIVAENVYGLVSRKRGVAFETVCNDLENEGYTVFPPIILPAASVAADHRRDRVWIIANSCKNRFNSISQSLTNNRGQKSERLRKQPYELFERPAPPRLCRVEDGIPNWVDRVSGLGNAIHPGIAYELFKTIEDLEQKLFL